eukprot:TRINITY_DN16357_c0_g4_i1.p1 TRINITY_DN16357_c0_g4~~TRINITY_DN16357_c0_g4_i1.p1  ORF type:complete len:232 (+),score=42.44 TRINITY_DN16357_c0_g4_i1:158-853(+)
MAGPAPAEDEYDQLCKVVLVGDVSVGKTHLLSRYMKDSLPQAPAATIGVEFATRTVKLSDGCTVKAQIWDTAGQERYRAITRAHYRRAAGAVLVYDVTRHDTFRNCEKWVEEVREGASTNVVMMLVGNKIDLVARDPSSRQVYKDNAGEFARKHGLLFSEASAVTAENVQNLFEALLLEVSARGPAPSPGGSEGHASSMRLGAAPAGAGNGVLGGMLPSADKSGCQGNGAC